MRRALALVLVTTGLVVTGPAAPAAACSCVEEATAESLERADVVFVGVLIGSEPVDPYREPPAEVPAEEPGGPATIPQVGHQFSVERVYRGEVGAEAGVLSFRDGATCGASFESGRFLVFAVEDGDALRTSLCAGNTALGATEEVPPELGPGTLPLPVDDPAAGIDDQAGSAEAKATSVDRAPADDPGPGPAAFGVIVGMGGLLLVGVAVLVAKRRTRGRAAGPEDGGAPIG